MKKFLILLLICLPCYGYECNIPEPSMPNYIEYIVECKASPDIQNYQFTEAYNKLNPIWTNYGNIANDKYSYTDNAKYIKEKTYTHWLYSKVGSQLYEHNEVLLLYGQMSTLPILENTMNELYGAFPKVGHYLQREYITAFISLGNTCIKQGKFPTQMERDVYICHCLYLLRATTDRHAYYQLSFHIKKIAPILIKTESLYPYPEVRKFVTEQINLKDRKLN